jgi:ribonucleoside-diphosphate reductase beta chain
METTHESKEHKDPLSIPEENRRRLKPIRHPLLWANYKQQQAAHWTADQIDYSHERAMFEKLAPGEQTVVLRILAFFATADAPVMRYIMRIILSRIEIPEAECANACQAAMEATHQESYSDQLMAILPSASDIEQLLKDVESQPAIQDKLKWMEKWSDESVSTAHLLVIWALAEGVLFCSSFASLMHFRAQEKLPGIGRANEYIMNDENSHRDLSCIEYKHYIHAQNKLSEKEVHAIVKDVVGFEIRFAIHVLEVEVAGLSLDDMEEYIKFCADVVLHKLGHSPLYNARQPFDHMKGIGQTTVTNIFEREPASYDTTVKAVQLSGANDGDDGDDDDGF